MLGDTNFSPTVSRRLIHHGTKFDFESLTVSRPGGGALTRECVRHPGAVVILPILDTPTGRQVVLIRNWRLSLERYLWELPAGTLEKGEDPGVCAGRELLEETGYQAATLTPLSRFHTSPGMSDELMWAFVATGLRAGEQALEQDERITVHPTGVDRVFEMIANAEMTDAKSMLTLHLARASGLL